jgi:beta-glucanase (GH16 family)
MPVPMHKPLSPTYGSSSMSRLSLALLALALTFTFAVSAAQADPPPADPGYAWVQTFGDDFNGSVLDSTKWNTCYWWVAPDGGCTSSGNNELEWYRPANVSVAGGLLDLRAKKETVLAADGRTYNYTSGMVSTGRTSSLLSDPLKYEFKYGYLEIRAKPPAGTGLWPAFFTFASSQAWPPEVDAMEMRGDQPTTMYLSSHYTDSTGAVKRTGTTLTGTNWTSGFHTYAIDWRPGALYFYVDGVARWYTLDPMAIPQEPMYVLANLAVGGTFAGSPDRKTKFPADFLIDWIKVWQQASA